MNNSPRQQVWYKIKKNKTAMFSLFLIGLTSVISILCYLIMPDKTPMANRMCLPISNQPPGFRVKILRVVENKQAVSQDFFLRILYGTQSNEEWVAISGYRFVENEIVVKEFMPASSHSHANTNG